jgi:hypothetical protein
MKGTWSPSGSRCEYVGGLMREPCLTVGRRSLRNCLRPLLLSPALFFRSSFSLWLHQLKTRTAPPTSRATQVVRFIWKSSFRLLRNHICTLNLLLYFCPVFFCRRWFEGGGRNLLPFLFWLSQVAHFRPAGVRTEFFLYASIIYFADINNQFGTLSLRFEVVSRYFVEGSSRSRVCACSISDVLCFLFPFFWGVCVKDLRYALAWSTSFTKSFMIREKKIAAPFFSLICVLEDVCILSLSQFIPSYDCCPCLISIFVQTWRHSRNE